MIAIILVAFWSGFAVRELEAPATQTSTIITTTITSVTYVQISGTNHSVFYVTEYVEVEPEYINEICIAFATNTTIHSSYSFPSVINGSNPIGIITTSTSYDNFSTTTLYENVTEISSGTTCTLLNPHYNLTITQTCSPCG